MPQTPKNKASGWVSSESKRIVRKRKSTLTLSSIAQKVAEFDRRILKLNGRLIYSIEHEYPVYMTDKLIVICENGHERECSVRNAVIGGCLICWRTKIKLDDLFLLAKSKGGACLSKEYKNTNTQYIWRCEKGHIWESTHHTVVNHWCPSCAAIKKNERYKSKPDIDNLV